MIYDMNTDSRYIVFLGRESVGKASLISAMVDQDYCIVKEADETLMEYSEKTSKGKPFKPVVLVKTAGLEDFSENDSKDINKMLKTISIADLAVVVVDAREQLTTEEWKLFNYLAKISVPFVIAVNKIEFGVNPTLLEEIKSIKATHFEISCKEKVGIDSLKTKVIRMLPSGSVQNMLGMRLSRGDLVLLVIPDQMQEVYPDFIPPHVKMVKNAFAEGILIKVVEEHDLRRVLDNLKTPPDLIVTEGEAMRRIAMFIPAGIRLTTYSIIVGKLKGNLQNFVHGLQGIKELRDGDKVLIAEACMHHPQAFNGEKNSIADWLSSYTRRKLRFDFIRGLDLPANLAEYKLLVHCSGCMISRQKMQVRLREAKLLDVPVVNFGVLLSYIHGTIPRSISPFNEAITEWQSLRLSS